MNGNKINNTKDSDRDKARAHLITTLPVSEKKYQLAGIPTVVLEGGSGPSLILLHGPGESSLWWMRTIPELIRGHHLVIPDLPGHGESGLGREILDAEHIFNWLDALIERTCESTPDLVGHLLGGAIAARYAIRDNKRIRRLILVDSFGLDKFRPSAKFAFGLIKFLIHPNEQTYDRFLPQCMFNAGRLQREMGKDWQPFLIYNLDIARNSDSRAAMRFFLKQFAIRKIPAQDLAGIDIPVSLIWGRHDKALKLNIAEAARRRYGWPLYVIEEARDDPKLEQPVEFVNALNTALNFSSGAQSKKAG